MIRFFDLLFSIIGLIFLSPLFIIISLWIKLDSSGPVFYVQTRVGRLGQDFKLLKFRSMHCNMEQSGLLTVGERDPRITRSGFFIRKYKLDELPQLINVLLADMSIVGPRPEVRKYVNLYTEDQKVVLLYKPGITDYASIVFRNENELLAGSENPEDLYISLIMPEKLRLNLEFVTDRKLSKYFKIICLTILSLSGLSKKNRSSYTSTKISDPS
jgi:lipopolysaccharide/colanic/teichoic acid biosynthesis glycosyltransferase